MVVKDKEKVIEEQTRDIIRELTEIHEEAQSKDIDFFIDKIKILENILRSKSIFMLLDHNGFNPWYVSESIHSLGYSPEQIMNGGLSLALKIVDFRQIFSARHLIKWGRNFRDLIGSDRLLNSHAHICGLAFFDSQKRRRVFMTKLTTLRLDKNQELSLSLIQAEDITSLYKSKSYWVKYFCDTGYAPIKRCYSSDTPNKELQHLLTNRELEIIKLAALQKKNVEIAQELDITIHTVERHRKNMIAKSGVTDMTALITIAEMADIL